MRWEGGLYKEIAMGFRQDNHYVSRMYLEFFATSPRHVLTYPILVAHERVPLWKRSSIKGIAYRAHLYTRIVAGGQTDEMEAWFNKEFETPAEDALRKATELATYLKRLEENNSLDCIPGCTHTRPPL